MTSSVKRQGVAAVVVLFSVAIVVTSIASAGRDSTPVSSIAVNGHIDALAQDGNNIAWISGRRIELRNLATGAQTRLARTDFWTAGETSQDFSVEVFALGGTRVLWGAWNYGGGFNDYGAYATVAPGQSPAKLKDLVAPDLGFYGDYITGAAGDGSTLLYSTIDVGIDRDPDSCADGPCVFRVTGGDVERVTGHTVRVVPGVAPPIAISVSGERVVLVPAGGPYRCLKACDGLGRPEPQATPNGTIEIRDPSSGALVASFSPEGTAKAVALARSVVAVLVRQGPLSRIERYDTGTGALIGSKTVPSTVADDLTVGGLTIVYRVGQAIWLLDAISGKTRLVHTASATPIGLSIEGRRLAWAENFSATRARIQLMVVPSRLR